MATRRQRDTDILIAPTDAGHFCKRRQGLGRKGLIHEPHQANLSSRGAASAMAEHRAHSEKPQERSGVPSPNGHGRQKRSGCLTQRRILITGASRGLGAMMAQMLAAPNVTLFLCARDLSRLERVALSYRKKGASVFCACVDVADRVAVSEWVEAVWADAPVDLAIFNAGIFEGRTEDGSLEHPEIAAQIIATNLNGAVVPALVLAEHMRRAGKGEMLFVSSLAAVTPLSDAPSYCASKAGLTAFARALREDLSSFGVRVVIAHPGHIETDQTLRHKGAMPGIVSAEDAATRILRGLNQGRSEIAFPGYLLLGLRCLRMLPWRWQKWINARYRFVVSRTGDAREIHNTVRNRAD